MTSRPKIKIRPTASDIILEILAFLSLAAVWSLIIIYYPKLPETIPTHYNASGVIDGYGSKESLLSLPKLATFFFILMTVLNFFPHIFNYGTAKITEENALAQYTIATRMLRWLKLALVVIFGLMELMTILNVYGKASGLGAWFMPVTLILLFAPLVYFGIKSFSAR
ncbi:DUF1648 domain-containing protein [Bacteroidales bacterium OttesenSCG-928-K22]|nr:DUF1648 domain-containing protein [Bacteroidales bacterium OttesenSCG-928-K22]